MLGINRLFFAIISRNTYINSVGEVHRFFVRLGGKIVTRVCSKDHSSIIFYAREKFLNCWNTAAKRVVFMLHELHPCPMEILVYGIETVIN